MRCVSVAIATAVAAAIAPACHPAPACTGPACAAACPRDAAPDASGRCACAPGDVPLAGACVPLPVADAYCTAPARALADGACAFPACAPSEAVDVDAGCVALGSLAAGGPRTCPAGAALIVDQRHPVCVPADAACPRGTRAEGSGCAHAASCPPGTLPAKDACRPVVLRGAHGEPLVDTGAWAALALGPDGGTGTPELCRPLQARPAASGMLPGTSLELRLRVVLDLPDQDVSRVRASVAAQGPPGVPLPPDVERLAAAAVAGLVEPLRGLGGQATAARVEVEVGCLVARL